MLAFIEFLIIKIVAGDKHTLKNEFRPKAPSEPHGILVSRIVAPFVSSLGSKGSIRLIASHFVIPTIF